jgi:hypothetical protein
MKTSLYVFVASALFGSIQPAAAQGTSGGNGAVASIPGSVVRDHEQGPGLFSILTNAPLPNQNSNSANRSAPPASGEGQVKLRK